jgi:hypothetical protein
LDLNLLLYLLLFLLLLGLSVYSIVRRRLDEHGRRDEPASSGGPTTDPEGRTGDTGG